MGLCYRTSRWLDRLWGEHLEMSSQARELLSIGVKKQGDSFAGFPSDIHARLYLPSDPPGVDPAPDWASRLHVLASELGEWNRLRSICARNGFAAGVAAEAMLAKLVDLVPDRPPAPPPGQRQPEPGESGPKDGQAQPGPGQTDQGAPAGESATQQEAGPSDADVRAALRRATRAARDAVLDAEASLEGITSPMGISMPGTAVVHATGPANIKAIRDVHSRLKDSPRLRQIAELAGRLERVAATKAKSKVKPGVGEIHGIEIGGDLARLLPSELVSLRHPKRRLVLLSRLLQRQALCYAMTGREPQARGPIVVLLDESSSMREHGKDVWSKAVCLALLSTATKQRRSWHLVGFNGAIVREVAIPHGKATPANIQRALDHSCAGGTDFDAPVRRAIDIIRTSATMKQADVVVITDGEDTLEHGTIEAATSLTKTEGVSFYVVGVGPAGDKQCARSLGQIATSMVHVSRLDDPEPVVPVINLEEGQHV